MSFSERLLAWWERHGRHDLPWQTDRSPYRVWLSEIMLQQTQVATAKPYFERFTQRFPELEDLARAEIDEVLALWSGLGYYARARNLHRSAELCLERHDGSLPEQAEALQALPGVGRSTANAILAQAWDRRAPILDGNVKRVLARHRAIAGWPGRSSVEKLLWQAAEELTPDNRAADYTQAIMDLGATVCRPRNPDCRRCPVAEDCRARIEGRTEELPGRRPKKTRPRRQAEYLLLRDSAGRVLLERRPPAGIWGGLWSLPEHDSLELSGELEPLPSPAPMEHEFSHFSLRLEFHHVRLDTAIQVEDRVTAWLNIAEALERGLPRPMRALLECLDESDPGQAARDRLR
ncbi:A/G-specific adenine glycosylase [Wenzhouxiangella marina]|uniref:Adenine DNA glycosylase n=1 Tax=Wenzhouxiangella marina TaxID=1579979 RepID=A0A0K0XWJ7_9GAMM|nr:A/G-specific adenine glycosylase [Wenzhouxiangella marina]AKS42007.1 Adenine glycosylase [Wenzhouxiangella marina]MBB6086225.1 A/G-specific adenine glycosylase [Wenzhouxiangella marina]